MSAGAHELFVGGVVLGLVAARVQVVRSVYRLNHGRPHRCDPVLAAIVYAMGSWAVMLGIAGVLS